MAQVIGRNVQLSHTGQQVDDAINSESNQLLSSISALVSLAPSPNGTAVVSGVGKYAWVSGDLTSADGVLVVESGNAEYAPGESLEGRWKLQYDGAIQASWWGIEGDGSTDYSAEFRSAMDAAVGSVLEVGPGNYVFNDIKTHDTFFDHIFEPPSNTDIRFDNGAVIVGDKNIGSDANGYALFRIQDGKKNISISGGVFDGLDSSTNKGMGAVVAVSRESGMDACSNLRFTGMTMKNLRQGGISIQSVSSQDLPICDNLIIHDNIFDDINGHGVAVRGCDNLSVQGNHVSGCLNSSYSTLGIDVSGGHNRATVIGNTIEECGGGIKVESTPLDGLQSYQAVVSGNTITDCSQVYGIRVSADYSVISGNTVRNAEAQGIDLSSSNNQRAVISSNVISGIRDNTSGSDPSTDEGHPVRVVNRYNSTTVERDRVIVANNVFEDCDAALEVRSSGVTIQGNKFRDFKAGQSAIRVSNGLSPDTLYDKLLIDGNSFEGFTTTVIYLQDDSDGTDGSDDVTITGNQIHGTGFALVNAENVTGLVISGNVGHVTGSGSHGIYVVDSDDVTISCNSLKALGSGTGRCVHLNGCDNVSVVGNTTESNDENIYLNGCDYFSVIGNVCNGGTYAVRVLGTTTTGVTRFNQDNGSTNGIAFDSNCNMVDGFYGLEVSQASAISKLTDSTGGSTDGTLSAISGSGDDSNINNNFAEVDAKISAIIDAIGASSGVGITAD